MWREFFLRSLISVAIAITFYIVSAGLVSRFFSRNVSRSVLKHDVKLGLISLISGTPMLQLFTLGSEKYGYGFVYSDIAAKGWVWWVISVPLYVLCWDLVFYLTHLVLHWPLVYRKSHFRHHACRPPVAWSGIAIDPLETVLSGILPYTVPLLFFPFHIYTVYALNMMLMIWATFLHSTLNWNGNAIFLGPRDHNLHHAFGLKNSNFAAVFTFWDWIGRTLNRHQVPPWWGKDAWKPSGARAAAVLIPAGLAAREQEALVDPSDKFSPAMVLEPPPPSRQTS